MGILPSSSPHLRDTVPETVPGALIGGADARTGTGQRWVLAGHALWSHLAVPAVGGAGRACDNVQFRLATSTGTFSCRPGWPRKFSSRRYQ